MKLSREKKKLIQTSAKVYLFENLTAQKYFITLGGCAVGTCISTVG